jgi:hypothetical protein
MRTARAIGENRPWSRAPRAIGRARLRAADKPGDNTSEENMLALDRLD